MKNLKRCIELAVLADIRLAVWGRHGVGKTAIVEELRNEKNEDGEPKYFVKTMILSQVDPLVLCGYPGRETLWVDQETGEPVSEGNGIRTVETTFAKPQWVAEVEQASYRGQIPIVFFDEFNRADKYAHDAAMRIINEKNANGHLLPKETVFIGAMNPEPNKATESDDGILPLSDPMIDRWCHIAVHTDAKTWMKWAKEKGDIHPTMVGFISTNPEALNDFDMEDLFDNQVLKRIKATPRSNSAVSRILYSISDENGIVEMNDKTGLNSAPVYRMIQGLIGTERASELIAYQEENLYQPFTVEEMLNPTKEVLEKAELLVEKQQLQVMIASLSKARAEIPKRLDGKDTNAVFKALLDGFFKLLVLAPRDNQVSFWYPGENENENSAFWCNILATVSASSKKDQKLLDEVFLALNEVGAK